MRKKLPKLSFERDARIVAPELLGKFLVRRVGGREIAAEIVEVEAYLGPADKASHARHGQTPRNAPMWGPPGGIYAYFCYGVHWMLNVVTGKTGEPGAVLIRGLAGVSGPGRVAKYLKIDRSLSGRMLGEASGLWVEDRACAPAEGI